MTKLDTIRSLEEKFDCKITCRVGGTRPTEKPRLVEIFTIFDASGVEIASVFGYRELVKTLKEWQTELRRLANLNLLISKGA